MNNEKCLKCVEGLVLNSLICMSCELNPHLSNNFKPREPKTIWVNEYEFGDPTVHDKECKANEMSMHNVIRTAVEYREVIK